MDPTNFLDSIGLLGFQCSVPKLCFLSGEIIECSKMQKTCLQAGRSKPAAAVKETYRKEPLPLSHILFDMFPFGAGIRSLLYLRALAASHTSTSKSNHLKSPHLGTLRSDV